MGGDNLDAKLEPLAEFLLIVIVMLIVAAVSSYVLMKAAQRRREQAHSKLSASRRGKESGIDLFGQRSGAEDAPQRQRSSGRRGSSSGSGFNLFTYLKQLAYKFESTKSRGRGKRRRHRTSSSTDNLRIDILKKPSPAPDAQQDSLKP